ncbi:TIGR03111 family XrtG-associated glycosyltransferase [Helicovermis profundi]|uniref:Glycosyltransferase, exosortase G system-associated n=1 Tax=Helicovermis profundi TaxID=3065157 RepID=A0AAU9E0A8_9FIRM|nr:putative glycosyltransferase, exosortase G system-associated [Clostridia bacterium S502]
MIINKTITILMYWISWLIIPLAIEFSTNLISGFFLIIKKIRYKTRNRKLDFYPLVSILIPVYNSESTLMQCLNSVASQNYPQNKMEVFLLNNQKTRGDSFKIFDTFKENNPNINIWWYDTSSGKAKALNLGILSSKGEYIINIDSDGWLDKNALKSLIIKFKSDSKISALTGVILIDPNYIKDTKNIFLKLLQKCESFEYLESFLIGRNFNSIFNSMYTLAGACSAFKRESLMQTQLYNFETVGEDTHMTFQIRDFTKGKILLAEETFFFVDPIESVDKLYAQRQRWQKGQMEVAKLFSKFHIGKFFDFFTKFPVRLLINDHTLVFPRLIWIFGMIFLYFKGYPTKILVFSNVFLYLMYVFISFFNFFIAYIYLEKQHITKKFLSKNVLIVFLLPIHRFINYWIRIAGIINSAYVNEKWDNISYKEEFKIFFNSIDKLYRKEFDKTIYKIKKEILDE